MVKVITMKVIMIKAVGIKVIMTKVIGFPGGEAELFDKLMFSEIEEKNKLLRYTF